MHPWAIFLIFFVAVVDTIVLLVFYARVRPRMLRLGRTMAERKATLAAAGTIVGEGLRESYSGDPETLPSVLVGIAPRLQEMLVGRGLQADAQAVRDLLASTLPKHGVPTMRAQAALSRLAA